MNEPAIDGTVERVLEGDLDAYEDIVRRYQGDVWKVVAAMLFDKERTEDLVQQTFIRAYQHLHRYQQGRDFGAWLKEIARNEVRQEARRRTREDRRLEFYQTQLLQAYDESSAATPEPCLEESLRECAEKLPPSSVKLVELRYQAGLNFSQIAAQIGRTVEASRQQLARVRLALRDCIEKHLAKT